MPSRWRSRSSAPTPASRSLSGRRGASCSSPPRSPASSALSTRPRRVKQAVCGYGRAEKAQVAADGADDPRAAHAADADARRRRARGRDLPRARAAAAEGGRRRDRAAARHGRVGASRARRARARRQRRRLPRRRDAEGAAPRGRRRARSPSRRTSHVREDALAALRLRRRGRARALRAPALRVSGVGPKVALAIVSGSTPGRAAARDRARGHGALRGDPRASARRRRSASCSS